MVLAFGMPNFSNHLKFLFHSLKTKGRLKEYLTGILYEVYSMKYEICSTHVMLLQSKSIHPFSSAYPGSSCGGVRLRRVFQTSFYPAMLSSSLWCV